MKVSLLNPEDIPSIYIRVGKFASICKSGEEKTNEQYAKIGKHCIKSGHFSASRSFLFHFCIEDISRVCSHQLVRHHVGVAINQASGVFQILDTAKPDVVPPTIARKPEALKIYLETERQAKAAYDELLKLGIPRSDARYSLGHGTCTSMNISVTLEALINLANERLCSRAQWEIREVVREMVAAVVNIEPSLNNLLVAKCIRYGECPEASPCMTQKAIDARRGMRQNE